MAITPPTHSGRHSNGLEAIPTTQVISVRISPAFKTQDANPQLNPQGFFETASADLSSYKGQTLAVYFEQPNLPTMRHLASESTCP